MLKNIANLVALLLKVEKFSDAIIKLIFKVVPRKIYVRKVVTGLTLEKIDAGNILHIFLALYWYTQMPITKVHGKFVKSIFLTRVFIIN